MFIKFKRLMLRVELFGGHEAKADITFDDGCTVIVTDSNTQGKSSLINSLAIGLGFDDLVKSNVSALINDTLNYKGEKFNILDAYIFLEVENNKKETLSIKRKIQPTLSNAMSVRHAPLSEWRDDDVEEYYVGTNSYLGTKGFHRLLSDFMDYATIDVLTQDDGVNRLYMEYVFAAIFIEQKRGWTDIMANTPYFRVKDPKKTTISEVLGMEYIQNNLQRSELKLDVAKLKSAYEDSHDMLLKYVNSRHFSLKRASADIEVHVWDPVLCRSLEGQQELSLSQIIFEKNNSLSATEKSPIMDNPSSELDEKLASISSKIISITSRKREVDISTSIRNSAILRYQQRMQKLKDDLRKNKEDQKIRKLFEHDSWSVKAQCPVCEQGIDESLLSQVKSFPTMSLDENVKYITEQKNVLEEVIQIEQEQQRKTEVEVGYLSSQITSLIEDHTKIQKSLSGAIPSELMAQARDIARLEQEIKSLNDLDEYSENILAKLKSIRDSYQSKTTALKLLKSDLSSTDHSILEKFQKTFKAYLKRLGYNSYDIDTVVIDQVTFLPRISIAHSKKKRKIHAANASSASDSIRMVTAYTLALHACRNQSLKSSHPNISVFDEPAQQNMDIEDHLKFFDIVSDVCRRGGQVIIAATDKEHYVQKKALELGMKVIDFKANYIISAD